MKSPTRKKILIFAVIIAFVLAAVLVFWFLFMKKPEQPKTETLKKKDLYEFCGDFESRLTSDNGMSKSESFVYLTPRIGGIYELDTNSGKVVKLPEFKKENDLMSGELISCVQLYDGKVFSLLWYLMNHSDEDNSTKFMTINANTGETECIYSVEDRFAADSAMVTKDDKIFYLKNLFGDYDSSNKEESEHSNEQGYSIEKSLVLYDLKSKEEKTLVNGVNYYYITGDTIYFDRINNKDDSVRLYYTTFDDISENKEPVDTGVDVGVNYNGYMWTIRDGKLYYANDTGTLYLYDFETQKTEEVFSSEKGIRYFKFWKDKIIYTGRFLDGNYGHRSHVSMYDIKTKEETVVLLGALQTDEDYDEETSVLSDSFLASDDLDYFIMEVNHVTISGSRYYKVYEDGTKEQFFEVGWEKEEDDV